MKFSYRILPERRLNLVRFSGSVSVTDVTQSLQQLWADHRYNPEYNGIVDLKGVTTRAKVEDLRGLLQFMENTKTSSGWWAAILTEPKPTALALIFKATFVGTFKLEIVSTLEAACKFLQIEQTEDIAQQLR